jgi:hypothetical protein
VEELTPPAIGLAASLGASRQEGFRGHDGVFGAVARRCMGIAPANVEDLTSGISSGLAARTVGAGDAGRVGDELRHRILARSLFAIKSTLAQQGRANEVSQL